MLGRGKDVRKLAGGNVILNLGGVRCLVLGGTGFIGRKLCQRLLEQGSTVRSLARNTMTHVGEPHWQSEVEWVSGSLSDVNLIRKSLRQIDIVFHLISTTLPATSNQDVASDLSANVLGTVHMLEAAKDCGVGKVIFASSGGTVYGIPKRIPIPEGHETNPICAYGIHKLTVEKYLHLFHHVWKLEYGVVRFSNPYGIGQPVSRAQGVIAHFVHRVTRGEPLEVWGDGSIVRDYIYIDDAIDACLRLACHPGPTGVFNIGTGKGHTLLELISMIEKILGRRVEVHFLEARGVDVPVNVLDISRAIAELHWNPSTDLETGIRRMLEDALGRQFA